MRKSGFALFLSFLFHPAFSQQRYPVTYEHLKEFEGLYEYINNTTLEIAASPRDTLLYAIINESKYKLVPSGKDLFLNLSNDKVLFFRDGFNGIAGYVVGKDSFKLLSKNVSFPKSIWYPRLSSVHNYQQPTDLKDRLPTGHLGQSGLDTALLAQLVQKIAGEAYPNVHSVLIIKDGKLVFEEYFYEYNEASLHQLRSATKSFVSALAGIAVDKGFILSKDEKVFPYFPEYSFNNHSEAKSRLTIENLLTNQSGLDCDISNEKSEGNETKMSYSNDWVKFTLDLPVIDTPGGKGVYCSGNVIVAGRILEKATGRPLPRFAEEMLFAPMGITKFKWNFKPDVSSAETFCQLYLRPRDMAKFGLLYLNKGAWNGRQIIPSAWVEQSFSKHSTVQNVDYGYLWWLKYWNANGVRYEGKAAQGNGGQRICVLPDRNMVVVITGGSYNTQSPSDELIAKYILPAFNKN